MTKFFAEVFERDNRRCVYCGRDLMVNFETFMICEEDHLIPLSKGGEDEEENIVTACAVCNRLKGSYKPELERTKTNRRDIIAEIRLEIMRQRAKHMNVFALWTHPE